MLGDADFLVVGFELVVDLVGVVLVEDRDVRGVDWYFLVDDVGLYGGLG